MEQEPGLRIRNLRQQKGMTVEGLASRAGLSKGYLSKLERGLKTPPISTLSNVARALGVEIAHFFQSAADRPKVTLVRAGERTRIKKVGSTFGYFYEPLADGFQDKTVEPFIITMTPGAEKHPLFSHEGQEMIFVLEGRMVFSFGQERHVCEPGDCLYFDASVEHRGECLGSEEARALIVIMPAPTPKGEAAPVLHERVVSNQPKQHRQRLASTRARKTKR